MISTKKTIKLNLVFEEESEAIELSNSSSKKAAYREVKLSDEESLKAADTVNKSFEMWGTSPHYWNSENEDLGPDFEWFESGLDKASLCVSDKESQQEDPHLGKRAPEELDTEVCSLASPRKKTSTMIDLNSKFKRSIISSNSKAI